MNLWNETKSVPVSREMVWAAYKKVKANKGSAGVDQISMEEFDADRSKHLYKLWNRMASGSYFPPPVKEVEIAKKDGKIRNLGIPTIADRIGQMVIKDYLFLGYSFQPRTTKSKRTGKLFLGYDCAISISSKKRIADKMEELNIVGLTFKSIVGVAQFLNPYIRGWVNYYGKFRKYEMNSIFQLLRKRLVRWARRRYKRYKISVNRAYKWLETVRKQFPALFYHWQIGLSN